MLEITELDLRLYGSDLTAIEGPYIRVDKRKHLVLYYHRDKKITLSYPKYLLEKKLGRLLINDETTDHIDEDFTNDDPNNLQVLTRTENVIKSVKRVPEKIELECSWCKKKFIRHYDYHRGNSRRGRKPYCSRSCAGIASHHK